jgi:MoaA/NifB/PqqE/SkfB family radical SAM enzyme
MRLLAGGGLSRWISVAGQCARAIFAPHNYLIFFVTARCNARCPFCFYWEEIEHAHSRNELTLDEIRRFTEKAGSILYLSVGGGEPFLRKELAEIIRLFYNNCGTRFVNITTNGLQPERSEKILERILNENPHIYLKLNLSLEAWGPRHDEIRGVPGNFAKMQETYTRFSALRDRARYFGLNVGTTFSRMNDTDVIPLIDAVIENWNVNDHTLTYIRGDVKDPSAKDPSIDDYEKAVRHLEKRRHRRIPVVYRLLRAVARTMFEMNLRTLREDQMIVPCVAGGRMLTLSDDGVVKPCEILEAKEGTAAYNFGNLRDHDFDLARIDATPEAKRAVTFIRESKCHCTFECANMCNIAASPTMWPKVLSEAMRSEQR